MSQNSGTKSRVSPFVVLLISQSLLGHYFKQVILSSGLRFFALKTAPKNVIAYNENDALQVFSCWYTSFMIVKDKLFDDGGGIWLRLKCTSRSRQSVRRSSLYAEAYCVVERRCN